jgi:histidinol dehydrogenase
LSVSLRRRSRCGGQLRWTANRVALADCNGRPAAGDFGALIQHPDLDTALLLLDALAAEHAAELMVADPDALFVCMLCRFMFLGRHTEAAGDYLAG